MAPKKRTEIVVLRMIHEPAIAPRGERSIAIHSSSSLKGAISPAREWLLDIVNKEVEQVPPTIRIRFSEWEIYNPKHHLFLFNDNFYDEIFVILAEDKMYWRCYASDSSLISSPREDEVSFSYCNCCFDNHYEKIVQIIQKKVNKN